MERIWRSFPECWVYPGWDRPKPARSPLTGGNQDDQPKGDEARTHQPAQALGIAEVAPSHPGGEQHACFPNGGDVPHAADGEGDQHEQVGPQTKSAAQGQSSPLSVRDETPGRAATR